jgi:RNA polymerase subunit RPABC4/transcription elongation factor Spt4
MSADVEFGLETGNPEAADEQPRTRHCRRCGVEINAASARCPYCGARQHRRQPILGWRGALVCLVLVAAAVFATRQVVESHPSPTSYSYYRSNDLAVLVPAGYHNLYLASPHGTAQVGFQRAAHPGDMVMVRATVPAAGTPTSRLDGLAKVLRNTPGVAVGAGGVTSIEFPGGLRVPELLYTMAGDDYAAFGFDACSHTIAVRVTLSATTRTRLEALEESVPQSANAICDGPDFTVQDRADIAIPLSLPR